MTTGQLGPETCDVGGLQLAIPLLLQHPVHPSANLLAIPPLEGDLIAGFQRRPDLLQVQPLARFRPGTNSSMRDCSSRLVFGEKQALAPGSSCMRQD
jgi:hypothetical protein